jgi:hypothetical protein
MSNQNSLWSLILSKIKKNFVLALTLTTLYPLFILSMVLINGASESHWTITFGLLLPFFYFKGIVLWILISAAEGVFYFLKKLWDVN